VSEPVVPVHRVDPIPPRARAFQGLRAGVVSRSVAGGIDYAIIVGATLGTYVAVVVLWFLVDPRNYSVPEWPFWAFLVLGFSYMALYLFVSFATSGRTIGDRLMGLRVVGHRGTRMWWGTALIRSVFCTALPIGLFWSAVSRQNRSVQDLALRTSVIHDWPLPAAPPPPRDVDDRRGL
jgi:uncharacterized RDD family membrane protein YckC